MLRLAYALCDEYAHRSAPNEDGTPKEHLCMRFLKHLGEQLKEHGYPDSMPHSTTDTAWVAYVREHKPLLADEWAARIARTNPPQGCEFGLVALQDFTSTNPDDWVDSYQEYQRYKAKVWAEREHRPIIMAWSGKGEMGLKAQDKKSRKRARESHDEELPA